MLDSAGAVLGEESQVNPHVTCTCVVGSISTDLGIGKENGKHGKKERKKEYLRGPLWRRGVNIVDIVHAGDLGDPCKLNKSMLFGLMEILW